jgi:site-specific recombinase XerD
MSQQRRQRSFSAKFKLGGLSAPPMNKKRSPLCVIICSLMKWRRWSTRPAIAPPARTPAHLFHSPYVFVSERKAPLSPRSIREIVARTGRLAGLPFVPHPHQLRHACGYYLASRGHDTRAIQDYLGHQNIQHTVRYTAMAHHRFERFWQD